MRVLTEHDIMTEANARASIIKLMQDFQWHTTMEIIQAAGGSEGMRRLRELRKPPFSYLIERSPMIGSRQWQYRMVPAE